MAHLLAGWIAKEKSLIWSFILKAIYHQMLKRWTIVLIHPDVSLVRDNINEAKNNLLITRSTRKQENWAKT